MPVARIHITCDSKSDANELSTVSATSGYRTWKVPSGSPVGQAVGGTVVNHGGAPVTAASVPSQRIWRTLRHIILKVGSGHERFLGL